MLNRKTFFLITSITSLALVISNYIGTFNICGGNEYGSCMDVTYGIILIFCPFIPAFVLTTALTWAPYSLYESWFRFARWWIPLSMLAIFLTPEYSHDWMYGIEKGMVAFAMSTMFIVVSILIIAVTYAGLKRRG